MPEVDVVLAPVDCEEDFAVPVQGELVQVMTASKSWTVFAMVSVEPPTSLTFTLIG